MIATPRKCVCGGEPQVWKEYHHGAQVRCIRCGIRGPMEKEHDDGISGWDKMILALSSHDALVEAVRTLLENPIVRGMSARIRGEAKERGVPNAYETARTVLNEAEGKR